MKRLLTPAILLLVVLLSHVSPADVITVDDDGGADYLTIQEAVYAAAWGDTVLVYPGTYTDTEDCGGYGTPVNVCIYNSVTLVSSDGPEVTVIESGEWEVSGVIAYTQDPVVVEGFTVRHEGWGGWAAITVVQGEVRGNVCTGFEAGITNEPYWYPSRSPKQPEARDGSIIIAANVVEGGGTGIYVHSAPGLDAMVSGNSVSGSNFAGIEVCGIGSVSLVGNEISGNRRGVRIRNPSHCVGAVISVELLGNRIEDSIETSIDIVMSEVDFGSECSVTIGGSPADANDIHGAPVNLYAASYRVDLDLDATYNFWGSVVCSTFVPLFDIHENVPDSAFVFEPFVDETHTVIYENCEGVPVEHWSWGSIKAIYR